MPSPDPSVSPLFVTSPTHSEIQSVFRALAESVTNKGSVEGLGTS